MSGQLQGCTYGGEEVWKLVYDKARVGSTSRTLVSAGRLPRHPPPALSPNLLSFKLSSYAYPFQGLELLLSSFSFPAPLAKSRRESS